MEDVTKLAVAAGISIPAAKLLYNKYKEHKLKSKYIKGYNKRLDNYLPHDLRQDMIDDVIDYSRGRM